MHIENEWLTWKVSRQNYTLKVTCACGVFQCSCNEQVFSPKTLKKNFGTNPSCHFRKTQMKKVRDGCFKHYIQIKVVNDFKIKAFNYQYSVGS